VIEQRRVKGKILQQAEADELKLAVVTLQAMVQGRNMKSRIVMIIHDAI